MQFLRLSYILLLIFGLACRQTAGTSVKLMDPARHNAISKLSITHYDAGMKSICLDSSGFYYLCCDTDKMHSAGIKPRRVNLSKYTDELKLFQSFDVLYFSRLDKAIGVSCGVTKEPFTVVLVQDGHEYNFQPGICSNYSSTSLFYKLQQVKDFFVLLKSEYNSSF